MTDEQNEKAKKTRRVGQIIERGEDCPRMCKTGVFELVSVSGSVSKEKREAACLPFLS
jgi:hypothetical protein